MEPIAVDYVPGNINEYTLGVHSFIDYTTMGPVIQDDTSSEDSSSDEPEASSAVYKEENVGLVPNQDDIMMEGNE